MLETKEPSSREEGESAENNDNRWKDAQKNLNCQQKEIFQLLILKNHGTKWKWHFNYPHHSVWKKLKDEDQKADNKTK